MLKFFVFFLAAFALLPTVVADPVHLNFTFQCEIPEIKHWCAEVLVWEEDSSTFDALEYSWQCTSGKIMKFQLSVSPDGDGLSSDYEMNWKIYTDCTSKHSSKQQHRCECYPTENPTSIPTSELQPIIKHYLFTSEDGKDMTHEKCKFPEEFKEGGRNLLGTTGLDSPCDQSYHVRD